MRYPTGIKKDYTKQTSYSKRGMHLEYDINETNNYYLVNNIAVIYKKPTPITLVKVDYPSRNKAVIKEAYFKTPSTTDYNGLYKGMYLDFEAKETNNNSFPLNNIHEHQIEHLKKVVNHKGIAFIIVKFNKSNQIYYLEATKLIEYINNHKTKSIPFSYFEEKGYLIKENYNPRINYLKIVDQLYQGGTYEKENK